MVKSIRPILKWVGGKTQLLSKLVEKFPKKMHNYHEIFLGGGSVLIAFLSLVADKKIEVTGKIYAYDLNEPLIWMYKNIQSRPNEIYSAIGELIGEFNNCGDGELNRKPANISEAQACKENYYYWIRMRYNTLNATDKNDIIGSAMFIFMNKTCFRGVFRMGPNGFNVPFGHNKNPEIINLENLMDVSILIRDVHFECADFGTSLNNVLSDDYVYLDPPYAPSDQKSFVKYTENGFDIDNHIRLFATLNAFTETGKRFMLSNSDVLLVRTHFQDEQYDVSSVLARRTINSRNPEAKADEVIITNYERSEALKIQ